MGPTRLCAVLRGHRVNPEDLAVFVKQHFPNCISVAACFSLVTSWWGCGGAQAGREATWQEVGVVFSCFCPSLANRLFRWQNPRAPRAWLPLTPSLTCFGFSLMSWPRGLDTAGSLLQENTVRWKAGGNCARNQKARSPPPPCSLWGGGEWECGPSSLEVRPGHQTLEGALSREQTPRRPHSVLPCCPSGAESPHEPE